MGSDHTICQAYRQFLETLNRDTIDRLDQLAAPDMRFHDPLYDVQGIDAVKALFRKMFDDVDTPSFTISHCVCSGRTCFLRWHFTCRPKVFAKGHPWVVDGVTEVTFDEAGKVAEHGDFWDAGQYVYERIPLINVLVRAVKRRISK